MKMIGSRRLHVWVTLTDRLLPFSFQVVSNNAPLSNKNFPHPLTMKCLSFNNPPKFSCTWCPNHSWKSQTFLQKEKEQRRTSTDNDVFILLTWPGHRAIILPWLITYTLRGKPIKMNFISAHYVRHWDVSGFHTLYSRQESLHQLASSVSQNWEQPTRAKYIFVQQVWKLRPQKRQASCTWRRRCSPQICSGKLYNVHLLQHKNYFSDRFPVLSFKKYGNDSSFTHKVSQVNFPQKHWTKQG